MNELTSILRDGQSAISVPALGRVWHLGLADWGVQGAFTEWLIMEAKVRLFRQRDRLDEETRVENARRRTEKRPLVDLYGEDMTGLSRRIDVFEFDWAGPVMTEALNKERPFAYLLHLLLKERHPDMTPEQAQEIVLDNPQMVAEAVTQALAGGDPKHFAAAARAIAAAQDGPATSGTASAD